MRVDCCLVGVTGFFLAMCRVFCRRRQCLTNRTSKVCTPREGRGGFGWHLLPQNSKMNLLPEQVPAEPPAPESLPATQPDEPQTEQPPAETKPTATEHAQPAAPSSAPSAAEGMPPPGEATAPAKETQSEEERYANSFVLTYLKRRTVAKRLSDEEKTKAAESLAWFKTLAVKDRVVFRP